MATKLFRDFILYTFPEITETVISEDHWEEDMGEEEL